jgi:hypothetical protein
MTNNGHLGFGELGVTHASAALQVALRTAQPFFKLLTIQQALTSGNTKDGFRMMNFES